MYKAVEVALNEVGYMEKRDADPRYLDDPKANQGTLNFTKYTRDLDALGDFYNTKKQGTGYASEYCEIFVDWCFVVSYGEKRALAALYQPKRSAGAGCEQSVGYYRAAKRFFTTPAVGDQIYFTYGSGTADHTGIVYALDKQYVYTVEGNTSNGVFKRQYKRTDRTIYGYGRPDYAAAGDAGGSDPAPAPDPVPEKPINDGGNDDVKLATLQKGSTGGQVRSLQALLIKKWGISCGIWGVDGDYGDATKAAVERLQREHSPLAVDGICGVETWSVVLGVK